jgi:hypothetical protein
MSIATDSMIEALLLGEHLKRTDNKVTVIDKAGREHRCE